jgi:hypothetical protein
VGILFLRRIKMSMTTPAIPPRRIGFLISWHLSKNGGFGHVYVPLTQQHFFLHRELIVMGEPTLGARVIFTPAPAKEGTRHMQATQAVIDTKTKPLTALEVLDGKEVATKNK